MLWKLSVSSQNNITVNKQTLFYLQLSRFVGQAVAGLFLGAGAGCPAGIHERLHCLQPRRSSSLCPAAENQTRQTSFIHISSHPCGLWLKTKGTENLLLLKTLHETLMVLWWNKEKKALGSSPRWRCTEPSLNRSKINTQSSRLLPILGVSEKEQRCSLVRVLRMLLSDNCEWKVAVCYQWDQAHQPSTRTRPVRNIPAMLCLTHKTDDDRHSSLWSREILANTHTHMMMLLLPLLLLLMIMQLLGCIKGWNSFR